MSHHAKAAPVLIVVETTPNPLVRKFLPGREVTGDAPPVEVKNFAQARRVSPLAAELFDIEEIASLYLARDFISVLLKEESGWDGAEPLIMGKISGFFRAGGQAMAQSRTARAADPLESVAEKDRETATRVLELIETRVRPAVAQDGGDIVFRGYGDGVVSLEMRGACAGCPSSQATLRQGVESMLRHFVPEVQEVRQVFD